MSVASQEYETAEALRLIRVVRNMLRDAGAVKAAKRVASVIHSVEGAARHARLRKYRKC